MTDVALNVRQELVDGVYIQDTGKDYLYRLTPAGPVVLELGKADGDGDVGEQVKRAVARDVSGMRNPVTAVSSSGRVNTFDPHGSVAREWVRRMEVAWQEYQFAAERLLLSEDAPSVWRQEGF